MEFYTTSNLDKFLQISKYIFNTNTSTHPKKEKEKKLAFNQMLDYR